MDDLARVLFEESPDAVFLTDPSGRILDGNEAAARLVSRDRESLAGGSIADALHPATTDAAKAIQQALAAGQPVAESAGFTSPDGIPVTIRVAPAAGRRVVMVRPFRPAGRPDDDTEARYRRLFRNNLAGVWRSTVDGKLLECNDAFARVFGYPDAAALRDANALDLYWDEVDRGAMLADLLRLGRLNNHEARLRRRDGSEVWVLENVYLVRSAGDAVLEGTLADITERKRAEARATREHALLRAVFESTPDFVFYKDRDGRYRGCNRAFEQYWRVRETHVLGRTARDVFPKIADELEAEDRRVYETRAPLRTERSVGTGEARRLVETVLTPLLGNGGEILGVLGISRDITDRRRAEERARQAVKMETVGQLAGGVAHSFNNLLTILLGNLQSAAAALGPDHAARRPLGECEQAARRAADLTGQLLGFARRAPMALAPTDLNRNLTATVDVVRRTFDPRVVLDPRPARGLWLVDAAGPQLEQVLMNLLVNARDAMPEGGRIVVATENVRLTDADTARAADARPGDFVRVTVEDTGPGIDSAILSRIFEPFFTTKPVGQGTGLGLAMAYGIVHQHKGWIQCRSRPGMGARFDIYLPRSASQPERAPQPVRAAGTETVLLVDDEPMIRNLAKATLERHGYRVILAGDGQEAVDLFRKHRGEIAVVVLDLTMPLMTGQEALRELKKIDPRVRALYASGYSADSLAAMDPGDVLGFLQKPYRPDELVAAVRSAIDQGR
ncbi:MAG TPA: PAS domain S-box protein [Gemmataceae bacterium]|nr:PAS domain S-box protein [Gemmataceae bacterium]